jgi:bZIP transcription factor
MTNTILNADASAADAAAGVLCTLPFVRDKVAVEGKWSDEPALKKTKFFHPESRIITTPALLPTKPMKKEASAVRPTTKQPTTTKTNTVLPRAGASKALTSVSARMAPQHAPTRIATDMVHATTVAPSMPMYGISCSTRKVQDPVKKKLTRLEQNRRAAKESRQRKSKMVDDLQRSVVFFTRANATLKERNEELVRLVKEAVDCADMDKADCQVLDKALKDNAVMGSKCTYNSSALSMCTSNDDEESSERETATLLTKLNQSLVNEDEKKVPLSTSSKSALSNEHAASVKACVETESMLKTNPTTKTSVVVDSLSSKIDNTAAMQPGSTMQAMASFQQAATAAMEEAMKGLQNTESFSTLQQLMETAPGSATAAMPSQPYNTAPSSSSSAAAAALSSAVTNAQQAYHDTMAAFAMQQAAQAAATVAATSGNPHAWMFAGLPLMMGPAAMIALQLQQQPYLQQLFQQQQHQHQMQQYDVATVAALTGLSDLKKSNL